MSRSVASRLAIVLAASLVALFFAAPALAADAGAEAEAPTEQEQGPAPSIDEIGTQNEVSSQYLPEPAEQPPFMRFLNWPLMVVGLLVALIMLLLYLLWQPRFAEERRSRRRR